MTIYGNGNVIGMATALPATSAAGFILADKIHPAIAAGFVVMNTVILLMLFGHISRYLKNRNA
jgi:hypothetical protein